MMVAIVRFLSTHATRSIASLNLEIVTKGGLLNQDARQSGGLLE